MTGLPSKITFADPDHWRVVHDARTGQPPPDLASARQWIHLQHAPGPFDEEIRQAVERVIATHQGTTEAWMGLTGVRHIGKTTTLTGLLIAEAFAGQTWRHKSADGFRWTPYVFVEAASKPTAKSVLAATARFLGVPATGNEDVLFDRLRPLLPHFGVKAIVVDEAQNFRRRSASATTTTDELRKLLHLPVPVIYCGLDLHTSALLANFNVANDSVGQLIARSQVTQVGPLTDAVGVRGIAATLRALEERLILIDDFRCPGLRDREAVGMLIRRFGGRPGSIMESVKETAAAALSTTRVLDRDRLIAGMKQRTTAA